MKPRPSPAALPALDAAVLPIVRDAWKLTHRQTQVAAGVARGLSNKEVATELRCEESTVEKHLGDVFRKSGAPNRVALAVRVWLMWPVFSRSDR